ncbi:MAG: hypothetical protein OXB95_12275, partial [Rhodobacteraceae bacterium]|nr:hypothetical protein [Paracoccaceae bacterium]
MVYVNFITGFLPLQANVCELSGVMAICRAFKHSLDRFERLSIVRLRALMAQRTDALGVQSATHL